MATMANGCFYPVLPSRSRPMEQKALLRRKPVGSLKPRRRHSKRNAIYCTISESGTVEENRPGAGQSGPKRKVEDYNTAMKRMMRNPYEYHHDLGMNYTIITDSLIVGSQPQKPEDIDHLKAEENVAYILCLQQDKDIEYWGIDFQSIVKRCKELGILHMRRPAKDFDPDSLRSQLPKAVSSLEWAISEGKGKVYIHCTAGLGRAPAVAIAYMFWFCDMDLNTAYNTFTSKRPCGPNKRAIRGATYDLAKNDPWKEPFESLPEYAFGGIADWERKLIQERVRGMRGA
ncbi:phosphoglucan phosphatase LSF2, chloroplastic isoform X1 [Elaeis guineensis]|uniref:Phosphoglucan phosphatase LSF2, chloroplastic isoform X1 n=1 Tax=Elaeis guineensis var. tenera TaxID=51953 RepID=A0A6I9RSQ7_ELAGV|nr:phosphoglucan phosphatase LSF2, chloroplastic isoform X1 [Elaeis guineensis]XP_010931333.1 phosphoglucan phosphatase LSF2, chloroplastic isoform X1 [Elaeis guineensis]XP_010931334.1 phosphoglucan phosphatase LSF2, chloroplastic isoform X1 [Elaeis guineensis]